MEKMVRHKTHFYIDRGLFRAVSKEVALSKDHYTFFRKEKISGLTNPMYQHLFEDLVGSTMKDYLKKWKMEDDRTWGTDVEIIALATLLNTTVSVY